MKSLSYSLYDQISKVPLLSAEEEVELSKKIEMGNKRARDRMINANLRLALHIAKKYANKGVDVDDLLQEAIIGLTRAVDQFDWSRGFKFSTYAYWWVQQAVRQFVAGNTGPISLPPNTFSKLYKISEFEKEFKEQENRDPKDAEIAEMFGTTPETLRSLHQSASRAISIDSQVYRGESGSKTLADVIPSEEKSLDDQIDEARLASTIRDALSALTEREKLIIKMRFGLDDNTAEVIP